MALSRVLSTKEEGWSGRLLHVAAVREVNDHGVAAAKERIPEALPVAVMQDAVPPVAAGVLGDHHHVDWELSGCMWQLLKFVKEVAERLHDQSVRRFNGDETHAWEELLKARANQRLLLLVKDNAYRDQLTRGRRVS